MTGYTGSNGLALVGPDTRLFVTDFRYVEQAAAEVDPSFERRVDQRELFDALGAELPDGELRLGFDDANVTVRQHTRACASCCPSGSSWSPPADSSSACARSRSPTRSRGSAPPTELADAALTRAARAGAGRPHRARAGRRARAGDAPPRGRSGPRLTRSSPPVRHGALPHATAARGARSDREQMVVIDWGAELDGYCSDCTRTVATGELERRGPRGLRARAGAPSWPASRRSAAGAGGREVDARGARR